MQILSSGNEGFIQVTLVFPDVSDGKESTCQRRRHGFDPWIRKIPWGRKWQLTPVFLHREFDGQRSLMGYSPWDCKELDMTEQLTRSLFTSLFQIQVMLRGSNCFRHGVYFHRPSTISWGRQYLEKEKPTVLTL